MPDQPAKTDIDGDVISGDYRPGAATPDRHGTHRTRAPKNIAVVAVHGVGSHAAGSSASAIARMLLRIPRAYGSHYTSFTETPIGISTAPVPEAESVAEAALRRKRKKLRSWWSIDERPERGPDLDPASPD